MNSNKIKFLSLAAAMIAMASTILNMYADDRKMEEQVEEAVEAALAKRESEKES